MIPALATTLVLLGAAGAPFADVFVDANDANCLTGTGSAASPVCSIAAAIGLAAPGDTIRIAPGTYVENVTIGFDLELIGTGGASVTTIDGGAAGSVITIPAAVTVTLDGLTITNGLADFGGGINLAGDLTISNSTISGCSTTTMYGYVYGSGGGIYAYSATGSNLTVENSTFAGNMSGYGGGLHLRNGTLSVTDSTFTGNSAYYYGGGFNAEDATVDVTDSSLSGNSCTGGWGGGAEFEGSTVTMTGTTLSGNFASYGGGAFEILNSGMDLRNCTISGNTTTDYGAGINVFSGVGSGVTLTHATITNNTCPGYGGGINNTTLQLPSLRNTIVAGNLGAGFADELDLAGPFSSLGYNLIGAGGDGFTDGMNGDQVGTGVAPLDPLLDALTDNGGPTETHELLGGSPAIDAADPNVFEPTDQRGALRPEGPAADVGALETGGAVGGGLCSGNGGDGMGCTPCPCGNDAPPGTTGGCINSSGNSARIIRSGSGSVVSGGLRFEGEGMTPSSFAVLTSGNALAPQNAANPCFGTGNGVQSVVLDGLRCAVQATQRHGGRPVAADGTVGMGLTNGWGPPNGPPGGIAAQGGFTSGQSRFFQIFYRELPGTVCLTEQNTSQASGVTFTP